MIRYMSEFAFEEMVKEFNLGEHAIVSFMDGTFTVISNKSDVESLVEKYDNELYNGIVKYKVEINDDEHLNSVFSYTLPGNWDGAYIKNW